MVLWINEKRIRTFSMNTRASGSSRGMDSLKKELEEELKLSTEDMRSHAWYHGPISREGAEVLLQRDGDFLIRDSWSSPGDYVLTCQWKNEPMHFKIIRVVLRPKKGYTRVLFQFEQDRFDNVPALVRFHVGGRRPISEASGAIIFQPITRTVPLRVISEREAMCESGGRLCRSGRAQKQHPEASKRLSFTSSQMDTLHISSNLLRSKDKSGSHPANLEILGRRPSLQSAQSDSNLCSGAAPEVPVEASPTTISPVFRTGSEPLLSPRLPQHVQSSQPGGGTTPRGSDGQLHSRAPPKPLRVSTLFPCTPSQTEEDPSHLYDELIPRAPVTVPRSHADRLRAEEKWQSRARITETSFNFLETAPEQEEPPEGNEPQFVRPEFEMSSCFCLEHFHSLLLPDNNRPLEPTVLLALKQLFGRSDARTTALHILSVDCQVARITGVTEEQKRLMGVSSGLELITLPHGHQLRQDLLERHQLLALGLAIDILGCTGTVGQRAAVLHKIIQLAKELRHTAHDYYAFSAVMKALDLPQVVRLEKTWRALRRNHTDSAVSFEKTLKPFMKALNEEDVAMDCESVSVPHLVPLLRLMEGEDAGEHTGHGCQLLLSILQSARNSALSAGQHQAHAHALLTGWEPIPELLEAFQTEFALRLFWGQAGVRAERQERYKKFDAVLSALSNKLESAHDSDL
ncbi:breast cancer anti-estrogen resistance protein 3 homolog isoform X2 [Brienomyrus brachyistius]|uniref:breast cancer anti-estrogen resistance protein 3 homolog isoform X2 n=1 Tax=Brienomyrus brachyistius TaxID=42636 RepID=UPI0020B18618|nr:breast cancer anti-estrogen resistance protein 3 homolog isoform X2 [Brienomyrus brachyistius]